MEGNGFQRYTSGENRVLQHRHATGNMDLGEIATATEGPVADRLEALGKIQTGDQATPLKRLSIDGFQPLVEGDVLEIQAAPKGVFANKGDAVLLYCLAVLVNCGGTYTLYLATCKGWLENVCGIH